MAKQPQAALDSIFAFPPNRDTLGGTAYLIVENLVEKPGSSPGSSGGNVLVDCPPWTEETQQFLADRGGVGWLVLTHRDAIGRARAVWETFHCRVVVQAREAYLLPNMPLETADAEAPVADRGLALWTPGYSPGSLCLYWPDFGGVLFSGRTWLPLPDGRVEPLRGAKTFHWPRQLRSLRALGDRFGPENLRYLLPGANAGFLRGRRVVDRAGERLQALDFDALREDAPNLDAFLPGDREGEPPTSAAQATG